MAQQHKQQNVSVGFKTVQLFKDQTLGIGSYGKVCKAKCDDLLCAAKLIHETLFHPTAHQLIAPQREHRLPMRRFEQECDFLSTIKHPNIVQYLGLYRDPDTGLPALLMELMDDSLTHFVESSTQPIPYHIQVNICHDITLALSFLHSNSIVHRDLSSNNVLLIGNAVRAKVTDFGMARFGDQNPRATHLTFTMCPGTDVFMPPEAVQDKPVYTEKIDCFSFGVITLQILTRQFPNPGDRSKEIEINQHGIPAGTVAKIPVPETERRQNHISIIDPKHTLLQVLLDCLKDKNIERPSAQQLCERLAAMKECPEYSERKAELEQLRPATDVTPRSKRQSSSSRARINMSWREGRKAPYRMSSYYNAVADGTAVYVRLANQKVYAFATSTSSWSQLPDSPTIDCPSVIVNNLLTLIGGIHVVDTTNKLFSLTGKSRGRRWTEEFPPMPTKRYGSTAVCTGKALLVAGGESEDHYRYGCALDLQTVEVMNTETFQWSTAADLPQPLYNAPGAVCGDHVYILSLESYPKVCIHISSKYPHPVLQFKTHVYTLYS